MGTNMELLVSVIIPVYNTEKYIDECLTSVVNQTYKNLQIILIDDGSTDSSAHLCDTWGKKDCRISVIHKINEGLGYTRNVGLEIAKGKYICFLDSDDTLDEETYEYCVKEMEEYQADACYFGRKTFAESGEYTVNSNIPEKLIYKGKEVATEFSKHYIGWLQQEQTTPYIKESSCCAMYRRDVIDRNHLQFPSERECLSEDAFFNLDICRNAGCVIIIPKNFYNYRYNPNSLTTKYDAERFKRIVGYYHKLLEYIEKFPEVVDARERVDYKFFALIRGTVKKEIERSSWSECRDVIRKIEEIAMYKDVALVSSKINIDKVDKNTRIFLSWLKNKRCIIIYLFYKVRNFSQFHYSNSCRQRGRKSNCK